MSIKTSKRIALGVITALVFAPFAAIAPASAAVVVSTATLNSATNDLTLTGRVGQQVSIPITATPTAVTAAGTDSTSLSFAAAMTSQPAGTPIYADIVPVKAAILTKLIFANTGLTPAGTTAIAGSSKIVGTSSLIAKVNYGTAVKGDAGAAAAADIAATQANFGAVTFTPTVVGTYTVVIFNETSAENAVPALSGTESSQTFTITVTSDASKVALTAFNSTSVAGGADGALLIVSLTDANGTASVLAPGETVSLLPSGTGDVAKVNGNAVAVAPATAFNLSSADFSTGKAYVNIISAAASTSIQVVATRGTSNAVVTLTFRTLTASTGVAPFADPVAGYIDNAAASTAQVPVGAVSTTYRVTAAAATFDAAVPKFLGATITDTNGENAGLATIKYDVAATLDLNNRVSFTVNSSSLTTAAGLYVIQALAADGTTVIATRTVSSLAVAAGARTSTPSAVFAAPGATVSVRVNLKDNFSRNQANQAITATVSGRNTVAAVTKVTDAAGNVEFTLTDAALSTSVVMSDVVTLGGAGSGGNITITYNASYVPKTITLGGGNNSALGVALAQIVTLDIAAGTAGPSAATQTISATLKDANGGLLAGVPVSWTVTDAGTKANILSTTATTFTSNVGVASTSVYAWANGKYTVTATSGALTASVTIDFAQETAAEARSISATASGRVVTANVKDRFGNPVPGVAVWASAPGAAFFGTGTKVATVNTDSAGNAVFVVAGADATITVTTYDPGSISTNANGAKGSGQTCAAVGKVDCAATATSFTATRVGTSVLAETGVGASLAAAGVSAATAAVTGITPAVVVPAVVYDNPTLTVLRDGGRLILSGTAADGEGDIIIYTKKVGATAWKERAKTLEVAAPGDFNGTIRAPKSNVLIRVKQEGTGQFSNQVIVLK